MPSPKAKILVHYIPTILVAALITYLSLLREPHFSIPHFAASIPHIDKYVHAFMYAVFAFCFSADTYRAMHHTVEGYKLVYLLGYLGIIAWGGAIEILQDRFFAPRTGDWIDFLADMLGTLFAALLFAFVVHTIAKKSKVGS